MLAVLATALGLQGARPHLVDERSLLVDFALPSVGEERYVTDSLTANAEADRVGIVRAGLSRTAENGFSLNDLARLRRTSDRFRFRSGCFSRLRLWCWTGGPLNGNRFRRSV